MLAVWWHRKRVPCHMTHVMSPQTMRVMGGVATLYLVLSFLGWQYQGWACLQCDPVWPGWSVAQTNRGNRWAGANTLKWVFIFATFPIHPRLLAAPLVWYRLSNHHCIDICGLPISLIRGHDKKTGLRTPYNSLKGANIRMQDHKEKITANCKRLVWCDVIQGDG